MEQGDKLSDTRVLLSMAWNLSLLCVPVCVLMLQDEKIMGLRVYGAGQSGMRSFLRGPRRKQLNLWPGMVHWTQDTANMDCRAKEHR